MILIFIIIILNSTAFLKTMNSFMNRVFIKPSAIRFSVRMYRDPIEISPSSPVDNVIECQHICFEREFEDFWPRRLLFDCRCEQSQLRKKREGGRRERHKRFLSWFDCLGPLVD